MTIFTVTTNENLRLMCRCMSVSGAFRDAATLVNTAPYICYVSVTPLCKLWRWESFFISNDNNHIRSCVFFT